MRYKFKGIFGKVFFYTLLILCLLILVTFVFFSDQIKSAVESTQQLQISHVFQPLLGQINGITDDETVKIAEDFHEKNTSFEFRLESLNGNILYQTKDFTTLPDTPGTLPLRNVITKDDKQTQRFHNFFLMMGIGNKYQLITLTTGGRRLIIEGNESGGAIYYEFLKKAALAFILILLVSILAAYLFAGLIAKPIKKIATDVREMSDLKPVSAPIAGKDEISQLAGDVYSMYKTIKSTILQLETEIKREKEMEENQRYFFSAASHELKTPISAAIALLEGILEHVVEPEQQPQYLRRCIYMMNEQNKLVTEILDIASLDSNLVTIEWENHNISDFISGILVTYQTVTDGKGLHMFQDIPENLFGRFDSKLFGKAFSNIIMNAIQNTPANGSIRLSAKEMDSTVRICVLNEGAMISEEILPKLFEPFYREDKVRSRGQGRFGLGLTIVKKALDLMKIPFSLTNTENGVMFWMDLPAGSSQAMKGL